MNSKTTDRMKGRLKDTAGALLLAVALVALATPVSAKPSSECLAEFHGVAGAEKDGGTVKCNDCDPSCDTDGTSTPDQRCTFRIDACVNQADPSGVCTAGDITYSAVKRVSGRCLVVPIIPLTSSGASSVCGEFAVTVKTNKKCKIQLKADSASATPRRWDMDTMTFRCNRQPASACPTTTTTIAASTTTTTVPGQAQAPVPLGSAANFVVLAGSTVTNTGGTIVTGDLGVSPGSAVTGFPPGIVVGMTHVSDPPADQAQMDLTTAFNDAAGRTVGAVSVSGNLGGLTLAPGLYKSTSSLAISSGDLTLDAQGDANAVFIFQMASTLVTTPGRQVVLSGGAKASNIVWQVGTSATLGLNSIFKGNILADQSITLETGATLDGRALTRIAAVTLDTNTITTPAP